MVNLGNIENYLGIQVRKDSDGLYYIHPQKYISKLLKHFNIESTKPANIPLNIGYYQNRASNDEKFHNEAVQ